MGFKHRALRALHRTFLALHFEKDTVRGQSHRSWCEEAGQGLSDFATFSALDEHRRAAGDPWDWRGWPSPLRDPRSADVARFRAEHADEVSYHAWLQFEIDRQLEGAAERARAAGLRLGLVQDLAVGSAGTGFDTWDSPGLFAMDASVGCPPDPLGPEGQDWGLPPLNPHRMAADELSWWRGLLRSAFRGAGGLRIDHVMSLQRLFWIPRGMEASAGAYVRQPSEALFSALAEEARRVDAFVVGEDLGTVPPECGKALRRRSMLSTRVLLFERHPDGAFKWSAEHSDRALLTATTHDLPPLAGWWSGRDLTLRRELGLIEDDAALREALAGRRSDADHLAWRLGEEGLLDGVSREPASPDDPLVLSAAVHGFLCRTPAPLVAFMLDDLTGETEPVNVPGVPQDVHPSWTRRMRCAVEDLADDEAVRAGLSRVGERSGQR